MSEKINIGPKIELEGQAEYKKAIADTNQSMRTLQSELRAVSSEFIGNANSAEALRAKNEVLTKQQQEHQKKLELLRGALENANKAYGEGSTQVQDWQTKLNNAYADLNKLNRELDDNKKYLKEAENSTDKTAKSIDEFGNKVKEVEDKASTFGEVLKANLTGSAIIAGVQSLGNSLNGVATSLVNLVQETAAYADDILTLNAQTGVATDKLQELQYMQELTDVSLEITTAAMAKQIKSMYNAEKGTENYVKAYRKLKVDAVDPVTGALRDSDTVFWEAIDALGKMANETERDATAMLLFGRSAQQLNPLIKIGSQGVAEFAKEARKAGAVLSSETLDSLGATDDALQRLYERFAIAKRSIGTSIAPAMTEAFEEVANKVDEVDDKIADLASGAIEDVVDTFIWIIDNSDLIASGLKGIAAAFITKKTADGVNAAVTAYKTLAAATEVATAAQIGLNTATKASVIGLIASLAVGAGTAIYSYAKSASDAAEETRKLNDETEKLITESEKLSSTIQQNIEDRKETANNIDEEVGSTKKLVDTLYDLSSAENKSVSTKEQMKSLVNQINEIMPKLNLSIDEQTGLLNKNRTETDALIKSQKELLKVNAAQEDLNNIATNQYNAEKELNNLLEVQKTKREELEKLIKQRSSYKGGYTSERFGVDQQAAKLTSEIDKLNKELGTNEDEIKSVRNQIAGLGNEYNNALKYIGDHSAIDASTQAVEKFIEKYKDALDESAEKELGSLADRTDAIDDTYDKLSKKLEDKLEDEQVLFEKAQKKKVEAVKDASDKELSILEKGHKKKLDLIDKEYIEKIKLVDEERYKELKKVQDQIDKIETTQEAEDKAAQLKEEAEKRAELQTKISTATTLEDKMDAQKELAKFEEDVAADRLKSERRLQKDILEEQKETINSEYDAKVKALEEAEKKEIESSNKKYEKEKTAIQNSLTLKLEEIEERQRLEDRAFEDKQDAIKEALQDEKDLSVENAKAIYEEDLKQLKINNALKYDEVVANEEKIQKIMKQYSVSKAPNMLDTSFSNPGFSKGVDLQLYYGTGKIPATASSPAIDYDLIQEAMSAALKDMNLTVILNNKKVGEIIDNYIKKSLR